MRTANHLTLRYVRDRGVAWLYQRRHPDSPWLTAQAISLLRLLLRPTDCGLEFGSGRSTLWLSRRTAHLVSVETSPRWSARIAANLQRLDLARQAELHLVPADEDRPNDPEREAYLAFAAPANSLDYVLVDAVYRGECALRAATALRPGGLLVVDNVERYLPSTTRAPERLRSEPTAVWLEVQRRVADWRRIWTSNGVCDTAIWIKTD